MTLATAFQKTKLSTLIVTSLLLATSCTTLNSETASREAKKAKVVQPANTPAIMTASGSNDFQASTWREKLASCSDDYKKLIEPEINKFSQQPLTYDHLFATSSNNVDLANQLQVNETLECRESALALAEQMNQVKIEAAQQQLQQPDLSEKDKREVMANLKYAEQALFFSYVRHGLITDEEEDVQLWLKANDIWLNWINEPVVLDEADDMLNTLMTNRALLATVSQLTDYLQNYQTELNQQPKKQQLLLNQTLIFLAQAEDNNRKVHQALDNASQSLPWLKKLTEQLTDDSNETNGSSEQITVNETEAALLKVLQRDERSYFIQLLKLTELRYQEVTEEKLLESAKTFLTENAEDLAFSELLTAMDYAKLDDMESSKRWLDKAFAHNDIVNEICELPNLNPGQLNSFFNSKNGKQFLAIINQQCH